MSVWAEARTKEGRLYYWNKETKETTWEKPPGHEPSTPAGPTGSAADWSEAKNDEGRVYYYNKVTRETRWEIPAALQQQQQQQQPQHQSGRPDFVAGGGHDFARHGHEDRVSRKDDRNHNLPQRPGFDGHRERGGGSGGGMPWESRQEGMGFRGPMPAKTDEPEYGTTEAAEEAFFKLLRRHNVSPDTQWEDALKVVIRDREYRAIKDPRERKQAFEKYCHQVREQEKEKEKERRERIRNDFRQMLSTHDEIKHYTRWKTARPYLEHEVVYKSAVDDNERRRMFEDYILELKKKHSEREADRRKKAMIELDSMLKALILDPDTRWADAEDKIMTNDRFVSEDVFKSLHKLDVFFAFDTHMKALERVANENTQKDKSLRKRRQRQARDSFRSLLKEKLAEGKIKAGSKWQDFLPLIASDSRYLAYLGLPGSEPIEMFWDLVEDEERKLRLKRNDALDVLEEKRWEMTLETSIKDFEEVMRAHPKTSHLTSDEIPMIFDRLMEKVKRRHEESKIDAERNKRDTLDAIRSAMKRLEPMIRVDDSFDHVAQRLVGQRDWEAADEEMLRSAYEKHNRRLKDREEHDRDRSRRDRDRDREREGRNGARRDDRDRDRDRRHRTRTPEIDAYEADRRKAQEVRERQYRKTSFGLTPPPRDRRDDRYDRDRRIDRADTLSVYDRERRERELERERNYISRADPRDKGRTLDYGDEDAVGSRPGSVRKRRDSDGSANSRRDVKRSRRDRRTRSPEPEGLLKEEPPALQSGSEEGEIEEI